MGDNGYRPQEPHPRRQFPVTLFDRPGRFTANYRVDFLGNDGTIENAFGGGTGTARKLPVLALD